MDERVDSVFEDPGGTLEVGLQSSIGKVGLDEPVSMVGYQAHGRLGLEELGGVLIEDPEGLLETSDDGWSAWRNQRCGRGDTPQAYSEVERVTPRPNGAEDAIGHIPGCRALFGQAGRW